MAGLWRRLTQHASVELFWLLSIDLRCLTPMLVWSSGGHAGYKCVPWVCKDFPVMAVKQFIICTPILSRECLHRGLVCFFSLWSSWQLSKYAKDLRMSSFTMATTRQLHLPVHRSLCQSSALPDRFSSASRLTGCCRPHRRCSILPMDGYNPARGVSRQGMASVPLARA